MKYDITRQMLIHTILEMSKTISYKKVLICDITSAAGLSRNVFFYHFKNREAFFRSTVESVFSEDILHNGSLSIREAFYHLCVIVHCQRHFIIQALSDPNLRETVFFTMRDIIGKSIKEELSRIYNIEMNVYNLRWVEQFCAYAVVFTILAKLHHKLDVAEMEKYREDFCLIRDFFESIDILDVENNPFCKAFSKDEYENVGDRDISLMDGIKAAAKEKEFDQITTKDILDGSNMSRATFYRTYYNKYQLRNFTWAYDVYHIFSAMSSPCQYPELKENLMKYYIENVNLYKKPVMNEDPENLYFFIKNKFRTEIQNTIKQMPLDYSYSPFAVECIAFAITNCALDLICSFGYISREEPGNKYICDFNAGKYMSYIWENILKVS